MRGGASSRKGKGDTPARSAGAVPPSEGPRALGLRRPAPTVEGVHQGGLVLSVLHRGLVLRHRVMVTGR